MKIYEGCVNESLLLYLTKLYTLFEYGHITTITASSKNMNIWEGIQYRFIKNILQLPHISRANVSKFGNLPLIQHRLLHLSKTWFKKAITHNTSIQHYVNNHISKHPISKKKTNTIRHHHQPKITLVLRHSP